MDEQLYRRSMGMTYDPDKLALEVANGMSVHIPLSEEVSLYTPSESELYFGTQSGSKNAIRLQEIEYELSFELTPDERVELEAEKIVRLEQSHLDALAKEHPLYAGALHDWLEHEMQHLIESNVPIDDEMLVEAEILDQIIAEVNADSEARPLIKIAEVMKGVIEAQHELHDLQMQHALAA